MNTSRNNKCPTCNSKLIRGKKIKIMNIKDNGNVAPVIQYTLYKGENLMPRGEKTKVVFKEETYKEYCQRCKDNSIEPIPFVKWEILTKSKRFKFLKL